MAVGKPPSYQTKMYSEYSIIASIRSPSNGGMDSSYDMFLYTRVSNLLYFSQLCRCGMTCLFALAISPDREILRHQTDSLLYTVRRSVIYTCISFRFLYSNSSIHTLLLVRSTLYTSQEAPRGNEGCNGGYKLAVSTEL